MKMQIFENEEFGSVRTLTAEDGKILFCATDVAKMLGYSNPNDAILRHCKGIVKHDGVSFTKNQHGKVTGQMSFMNYIPEPDIYRLIFKSKLEAAERFEKWVVEEVLPTIRKTGAYITPQKLEDILANPTNAEQLFLELRQINEKLDDMTPKAEYFNAIVDTNLHTNMRITAKELHIPEKLFIFLLEEMKLAYRSPQKVLLPSAYMVNNGYATLKEYTRNGHGGVYMLFTPKGRLYLMKRINKRLALADK
ncbi:MAG: BRO family protein [Clostridia bacterium]